VAIPVIGSGSMGLPGRLIWVPSAQLDVPHAIYFATLQDSDGTPRGEAVGFEILFDAARMRQLCGTPAKFMCNRYLD